MEGSAHSTMLRRLNGNGIKADTFIIDGDAPAEKAAKVKRANLQQGQIHGKTVADGLAGVVMQKLLAIQKS